MAAAIILQLPGLISPSPIQEPLGSWPARARSLAVAAVDVEVLAVPFEGVAAAADCGGGGVETKIPVVGGDAGFVFVERMLHLKSLNSHLSEQWRNSGLWR